jgi:hypothetical protein
LAGLPGLGQGDGPIDLELNILRRREYAESCAFDGALVEAGQHDPPGSQKANHRSRPSPIELFHYRIRYMDNRTTERDTHRLEPMVRGIAGDGEHLGTAPAQALGPLYQSRLRGRTAPEKRLGTVRYLGNAAHQNGDMVLVTPGWRQGYDPGKHVCSCLWAHAAENA